MGEDTKMGESILRRPFFRRDMQQETRHVKDSVLVGGRYQKKEKEL